MTRHAYRQTAASGQPLIEERESYRIPHSAESMQGFVLSPEGRAAVRWGSIGVGIGLALIAVAEGHLWLMVPALGLALAGVGGLFMLKERLAEFGEPLPTWSRVQLGEAPADPEPPAANLLPFNLANNLPTVDLWQPGPGHFVRWLTDVLDQDKSAVFSRREGARRGWGEERYRTLIVNLRTAGLLHRQRTENKAPVLSSEGARLGRAWLEAYGGRPAPP